MIRLGGSRLFCNLLSAREYIKIFTHTQRLFCSASMDSPTLSGSRQKDKSDDDLRSVLVSTVLNLETLDPYLFRASNMWHPLGQGKRLFGGQIIGQAMVAAGRTVKPSFTIHSLHSYFVRPGDSTKPVLYRVHNQRDGGSFSTRTVDATQSGRTILSMMASYHIYEESPFQHQYRMPAVPDPDTILTTDMEELKQYADNPDIPEKTRKWAKKQIAREISFETKQVNREEFFVKGFDQPVDPNFMTWIRVKGHIGESTGEDGIDMQHCCLAYISDLFLASIPLRPNRDKPLGMICSLDHSMWFHAPFCIDDWMLYECESPQSGHGRGIAFGRFWRRDGTLAVTVAQESLLRPKL